MIRKGKYSPEFKDQAVKRTLSGAFTIKEVAEPLGITVDEGEVVTVFAEDWLFLVAFILKKSTFQMSHFSISCVPGVNEEIRWQKNILGSLY